VTGKAKVKQPSQEQVSEKPAEQAPPEKLSEKEKTPGVPAWLTQWMGNSINLGVSLEKGVSRAAVLNQVLAQRDDSLIPGFVLQWTGFKMDPVNDCVFAQWLAILDPVQALLLRPVDDGQVPPNFYSTSGGRVSRYWKGDHFDLTPTPGWAFLAHDELSRMPLEQVVELKARIFANLVRFMEDEGVVRPGFYEHGPQAPPEAPEATEVEEVIDEGVDEGVDEMIEDAEAQQAAAQQEAAGEEGEEGKEG
jgi:hypothetical protein